MTYHQTVGSLCQSSRSQLLVEHYLQLVQKKLPVVNGILERYGDLTISEYLQTLIPTSTPSYQSRDDLLEVVYQYATPLLGESVARRAAHDLEKYPIVLTANHHGVEYLSQTFQARLLFALNAITGRTSCTTVPVFACGNIPLDNAAYPQGLLFYHTNSAHLDVVPQKLPVFPNKLRRWMVSAAPAFTHTMASNSQSAFNKILHERRISPSLATSVNQIFEEDYQASSVLALPGYSEQAVVLNNLLWKRMFTQQCQIPELVFLEIEKIVASLCERDLSKSQSLIRHIMFDPELRECVLDELDGAQSCWDRRALHQRLHTKNLSKKQRKQSQRCGTIFFWGVDHAKRRIPLYLVSNSSCGDMLRGIDANGNLWEIPYTHREISCGLRENRLIPSLFTCFSVLAFSRGLICIGGYFQCDYLPKMQRGLVKALQSTSGYADIAESVACVSTNYYIDSMLTVMTKSRDGHLLPAGPLEVIAGGGIHDADLEHMLSLTVREAHLADMSETVPDAVPQQQLPSHWKKQFAKDCFTLLEGKIVMK